MAGVVNIPMVLYHWISCRRHVVRADLGDYFPVVVLTPAIDKNTKDTLYHHPISELFFKRTRFSLGTIIINVIGSDMKY
jgi:hypothetical protein